MNSFASLLSQALQYAIVSKKVSQSDEAIGFLYREKAVFEHDSGWRFFSGAESDEYLDDTQNFETLPLNEVLNRAPEIEALLNEPEGAWVWSDENDGFERLLDWSPNSTTL